MAYRGVKGSDPFVSKTSRNERFAQMSKQEQIIQQKKLEIQAKMQEMKAKQAVESTKKSSSTNNSNSTNSTNSTVNKTNPSPKKEDEKPTSLPTVNLFVNDGSFLDQFKKIASKPPSKQETPQVKSDEKKDEKREERREEKREEKSERNYENTRERRWNGEKNRDWENRRDRRRNESRWSRSSDRRRSSSTSPSPPRHRSSPSPDSRRSYHPPSNGPRNQFNSCPPQNVNQPSSIPSLVAQPMIQMTNVPPPNIRNLPPNVPRQNHNLTPLKNDSYSNLENHAASSRMTLAPLHMIRPPPTPPIRALHPNTNVPPPGMNMPQNVPINCPPSTPVQRIIVQHPPSPTCNIPALSGLQPPNIPPPNLLPPMSQMPPNMLPMNQQIVVTVPNVQTIPPPPPVIPSMIISAPPPVRNVSSTINSVPPPNLNIPPPNVPHPTIIQTSIPPSCQNPSPAHLLPTTYPLPNQVQLSVNRPNVQIPPPVRPPTSLTSPVDHAGHTCPLEAEQMARIVAECGDAIEQEVREKNAQDPKLWFLHQKQSAAYQQYRGLVAKFRAEKADKDCTKKGSGAELYCPEEALSDNDDVDKTPFKIISQNVNSKEESREERKRKRRSRWSEPDNKAPLLGMNVPPVQPNMVQPNPLQILPPGIPCQGQGIVPPKRQNTKGKNPMLTRVSRNDPALVQYAGQTFGTLDLSEEQWKKAEDHFKINLLYQNLLKKREEVKRLEAQGMHKYEYDSDEETEGGTWEHKLRSAEMEATQMWAEELTAQSEGKHHIGDFLPPDELKKFMEQYSALKQGKEPDLSDYKEFKLKEDNIGFQMLQKLGWSEGQGLGSEGSGRVEPVNKVTSRLDNSGLGAARPDGVSRDDDEFDAYRKRMMLAYRFRPNPLNNPRRPYY